MRFGERLVAATAQHGPLCVGIDPHPHLLRQWQLPMTADGAREFGLRVISAAAGRVGVVKPQVAFFERYGSAGYAALEAVLDAARSAQLITIADVKRGDVGSSVAAYAEAWLTPSSSLEVDCMTIAAFQGVGSIAGPIALAREHEKGLFVLCATSNPEAASVQRARVEDGRTVSQLISDEVAASNADAGERDGSIGLVVGATLDLREAGLQLEARTPVLAPGFGAQGAALAHWRELVPTEAAVLASVSRSVLSAGPDGLDAAIDAARAEVSK